MRLYNFQLISRGAKIAKKEKKKVKKKIDFIIKIRLLAKDTEQYTRCRIEIMK